jgi:Ecdysteroid kinase-like family
LAEIASTPAQIPPPASLEGIDAAWLTQALRAAGQTQAAVAGIAVESLAFTGATTDMARIRLTYQPSGRPGPRSAIVKLRGRDELRTQMDAVMSLFAREASFYSELAAQVPVRTPAAWCVGDGNEHPLVLEDLGHLRLGDQSEGLSTVDAAAILDALAAMHARFWDFPDGAAAWLNRPTEPMFQQIITQLVSSGASALAERFADLVPQVVLDQAISAAPRWGEILQLLARGPNTLVHNDCRLDNLFFEPDGTPVFVDWQLVACTRGIRDVSNLLAGSMDSEDLASSWEGLLRGYHARLCDGGVRDYPFDECVLDYRRNVVWALGQGMALLGSLGGGDGRGVGARIIRRALPHIAELKSFDALDIN